MFSKKGVSPLIATVLLLAFAVALATVIIQLEPFGKCNMKDTEISKIAGKQRVCFNEAKQEIEFFVTNGDKKSIVGFQVKASGSKDTLNIENFEAHISQDEERKVSIQFPTDNYGNLIGFEIYPWVNSTNRIIKCNLDETITTIPKCE